MKIGILGSRGIPNHYGGFEECAEQLAVRWVKKGHEVYVYNSHRHPYPHKEYQGVNLLHKYDAESYLGSSGQFIYDFNSIMDARWRKFDILLLLGYTSSSIWKWLYPAKAKIITNMDGMEWKRSKYSYRVQQFLKKAEAWAVDSSDVLIADSTNIRDYLDQKYQKGAVYIPYGADIFKKADNSLLEEYALQPYHYNLIIARLEPENNLEMMLQGICQSKTKDITLVIGNHHTTYGEYLKRKFRDGRIRFIMADFEKERLNNLRYFARIYFHGHSAGGTNPSLLEAMACGCVISAHDNPFNREVLGEDANYFMDATDVCNQIELLEQNEVQKKRVKANLEKIRMKFNWDIVAEQYEVVFQQALI